MENRGVHLFYYRSIDHVNNYEAFEQFYNCMVPVFYKLFINNFRVERNCTRKIRVFHPKSKMYLAIGDLCYDGEYSKYIGLYDLYSINESINAMQNVYSIDDEINNKNYAIIGECFDNIFLLLGINDYNRDQIFLENTNLFPSGDRILFLEENIFSFVSHLVLRKKLIIGYGIESYSKIYKEWHEDFWRIREE